MQPTSPDSRLVVIKDDITSLAVDAIVNAANSSLLGGGGVEGAIHRAGGPKILEECKEIAARQGGCKTGEAVITSAGNLPSNYVIHTVGPVWRGGKNQEAFLLRKCYANSLELAVKHGVKSIAFPGISTGVYGLPKQAAAEVAFETVMQFLSENDSIDKVYFVCFDDESYRIYVDILGKN